MSHDTNNSNVLIFLSDRRNLELNAATVQSEGVSRGVWDEDWSPERIQTSFTKYLEKKNPPPCYRNAEATFPEERT